MLSGMKNLSCMYTLFNAQVPSWSFDLSLGVEDDSTIRFRLKVSIPFLKDSVIGEAIEELHDLTAQYDLSCESLWFYCLKSHCCSHTPHSEYLSLYQKRGTIRTYIGKVVLQVEEIDDETAASRSQHNANIVITRREAGGQLKANTLREKVWLVLGRLDSLYGVIGKIEQLAKVRGLLWSHSYLTHNPFTY